MPSTVVIVLLLPVLPLCRLFLIGGFRRRLALFPGRLLALSTGLIGYVAACIALPVLAPWLIPALPLAALAVTAYLYGWRARSDYGRRRGLPPGSLRPAPASPWRDERWSRRQFRRFGPVFKTSHFVHPMVCIDSIPLAKRLLHDHEAALVTPPMPFNDQIPSGFMRYLPPRTYAAYRSSFGAAFASTAVIAHHGRAVRAILRRELPPPTAAPRVVADPARRLRRSLNDIVMLLFLGLAPGDTAHAECSTLLRRLDYRRALLTGKRRTHRYLLDLERLIAAIPDERVSYVSELRSQPALVDAFARSDASLWRNFIYVMITAGIDVADLLLWLWHDLAGDPSWSERVARHDPNERPDCPRTQPLPLATRVVMESLRLHQSEYLMRRTLDEVAVGEHRIPRGWLVRISIADSHRDPILFEHPDRFDPDRFLSGHPASDRYAPLGLAPRPCLGRQLTLWLGEQFLHAVFRRCRTRTLADGPVELGVFHWRPSGRWRPELAPLGRESAAPGSSSQTLPARARAFAPS